MIQMLVAALLSIFVATSAHAQEPGRTYRVGVLTLGQTPILRDMLPPLAQSGFIEGRNLTVDVRFGPVDHLPGSARDLAARSDVIVALGGLALRAAREATRTVPIVTITDDPVRMGLAQSLSRPGGNVTGIAMIGTETERKSLELLHDAVPTVRRLAVLTDEAVEGWRAHRPGLTSALANVGVEVRPFTAHRFTQEEYPVLFAAMREAGMEALWIDATPQLIGGRAQILALAMEARLPTVCAYAEAVPVGCMLSYSLNFASVRGRVGDYVARILRGEAPAEIPIERPMEFVVAVNLRTARALGITIPPALLVRATEVIE
jgi:putative ABC transport system substrate-binding protein